MHACPGAIAAYVEGQPWVPGAHVGHDVAVGNRADLLPVRIGLHTGPAVMYGWDWYGSTVNVAARLAGQAGPNEALVSATSRAAASGDLPHALGSRRQLRLRGVERPVVAWCLT